MIIISYILIQQTLVSRAIYSHLYTPSQQSQPCKATVIRVRCLCSGTTQHSGDRNSNLLVTILRLYPLSSTDPPPYLQGVPCVSGSIHYPLEAQPQVVSLPVFSLLLPLPFPLTLSSPPQPSWRSRRAWSAPSWGRRGRGSRRTPGTAI